ncbi:hypothetical protein QUF64_02840 [Anaerolineales bacterium HSG6]|nr:hypothetical protein [Anaerolineales bacterium HSG6]MDM8530324.1 hypothetical protein [Anaerolineales bacterium HSG25]
MRLFFVLIIVEATPVVIQFDRGLIDNSQTTGYIFDMAKDIIHDAVKNALINDD